MTGGAVSRSMTIAKASPSTLLPAAASRAPRLRIAGPCVLHRVRDGRADVPLKTPPKKPRGLDRDKKDIVNAIAAELGLTRLQVKQIVDKTFAAILTGLLEEGLVELRSFGVFEVKRRSPRKARNPHTGGAVEVPGRYAVKFRAGEVLQERVKQQPQIIDSQDRVFPEKLQGVSLRGSTAADQGAYS